MFEEVSELVQSALSLEAELAGNNHVDPDAKYEDESDLGKFQSNVEAMEADGRHRLLDYSFVPIVDPSTLNLDVALKTADKTYKQAQRGWRDLMEQSDSGNAYIRNRRQIKAL